MPQEISVSEQAIKSKVYRLVDALVSGEKTQGEVQDSIRRWWAGIHPADRPIAQKHLMLVLERSVSAVDAIQDGMATATNSNDVRLALAARRLRLQEMPRNPAVGRAV
jgi:hypothetical protein